MATGDVYEVAVNMDADGEELANVFHLESTHTVSSAVDLATRIFNQWIDANWETIVGLTVSFVSIAVRNLFDDEDRVTFPVGSTGDSVGENMPPHDAIPIAFTTSSTTLSGSKRMGGLVESFNNAGQLSASALTAYQDFVDNTLLQPVLGAGGVFAYRYVIVRRIPYTTSSGSTAYRLPENLGEADFSQVQAGVVGNYIRTQKSRDFIE